MSVIRADRPRSRYDGSLRWLSEAILGGFYAVYRELGTGFLESVYEAALAIALRQMGLRVEEQAPVNVRFRGIEVGLLLNFGQRPSFKRLAYSNDRKHPASANGRAGAGESRE